MKHSTQRILTTHVGSLARTDGLLPLLRLKEQGQPYAREELARQVREAVAYVVQKQVEAGVDIVTDGEQGKSGFFTYVIERFNGFERKPPAPGKEMRPRSGGPGVSRFSRLLRLVRAHRRAVRRAQRAQAAATPTSAPGRSAIKARRRFRPISPTSKRRLPVAPTRTCLCRRSLLPTSPLRLPNEYYRTLEEYEQAVVRRAARRIPRRLSTPDLFSRSTIRAWSPIT